MGRGREWQEEGTDGRRLCGWGGCGWGGWGGVGGGSDTTQNSRLTCLLCGASRTGLPPSLSRSLPPRVWPTSGSLSPLISPIWAAVYRLQPPFPSAPVLFITAVSGLALWRAWRRLPTRDSPEGSRFSDSGLVYSSLLFFFSFFFFLLRGLLVVKAGRGASGRSNEITRSHTVV